MLPRHTKVIQRVWRNMREFQFNRGGGIRRMEAVNETVKQQPLWLPSSDKQLSRRRKCNVSR